MLKRRSIHHSICVLVIVIISLSSINAVQGDPVPNAKVPPVFCFRIMDIERVPGDVGNNAFRFDFEVLNWTNALASGVALFTAVNRVPAIGLAPFIAGIDIDRDGRGGPVGGNQINLGNGVVGGNFAGGVLGNIAGGAGNFDVPAVQSGRGRGDVPGLLNDWTAGAFNNFGAVWDAGIVGTPIPNRDLLGAIALGGAAGTAAAAALVPGTTVVGGNPVLGFDATGDTAVDGGPGILVNPVLPDGTGNVLDGFILEIDDFDVGEMISLNWFLLGANGLPIGVAGAGNQFGFGTVNLARIPIGGALPGAVFGGNVGLNQNQMTFFDNVFNVPNPAEFAAEFGAGITAPFLNPADAAQIGNPQPNTQLVPEPSTIFLLLIGAAGIGIGEMRRRKKQK